MKDLKMREFSYSPGYCDMRGERYEKVMKKKDGGTWVVVCGDRAYYDAPTVNTTYEVSEKAAAEFEEFLKKNDFAALSRRKDSKDFICDYHAWEFRIVFDDATLRAAGRLYFNISQYKKYSKKDMELIKETLERFKELLQNKISEETIEEPRDIDDP